VTKSKFISSSLHFNFIFIAMHKKNYCSISIVPRGTIAYSQFKNIKYTIIPIHKSL